MSDPREQVLRLARVRRLAEIGEAKRIRERAGLSAADVARALAVSNGTVLRWEQGSRTPRAGAALRWLSLLEELEGVTVTADVLTAELEARGRQVSDQEGSNYGT